MCLGSRKLERITDVKYLGIIFNAGRTLEVDTGYTRRKFYASCNGILAHCKKVDEFVKLSLVRAYCLAILPHCVGALDTPGYLVKDLAVCWNDCLRRIFAYQRHEFVKELQYYCNELRFELCMTCLDENSLPVC